MNQTLEIALRAYIGQERNTWKRMLELFALSYNTSQHSATGFAPAYLLRGYQPCTANAIGKPIPTPAASLPSDRPVEHQDAVELAESFQAMWSQAQDALVVGQAYQQRSYNRGRLAKEFEEGDLVLVNLHSLHLLREDKGLGKKFAAQYDGPFEVNRKVSPVAYQLKLPASYQMHPVVNIAHLEEYRSSPAEFGKRQQKKLGRDDFQALPEFEVESILGERWT